MEKFKKDKQVITLEKTDKKGMLIARSEDVVKHAKVIEPVRQAGAPLPSRVTVTAGDKVHSD